MTRRMRMGWDLWRFHHMDSRQHLPGSILRFVRYHDLGEMADMSAKQMAGFLNVMKRDGESIDPEEICESYGLIVRSLTLAAKSVRDPHFRVREKMEVVSQAWSDILRDDAFRAGLNDTNARSIVEDHIPRIISYAKNWRAYYGDFEKSCLGFIRDNGALLVKDDSGFPLGVAWALLRLGYGIPSTFDNRATCRLELAALALHALASPTGQVPQDSSQVYQSPVWSTQPMRGAHIRCLKAVAQSAVSATQALPRDWTKDHQGKADSIIGHCVDGVLSALQQMAISGVDLPEFLPAPNDGNQTSAWDGAYKAVKQIQHLLPEQDSRRDQLDMAVLDCRAKMSLNPQSRCNDYWVKMVLTPELQEGSNCSPAVKAKSALVAWQLLGQIFSADLRESLEDALVYRMAKAGLILPELPQQVLDTESHIVAKGVPGRSPTSRPRVYVVRRAGCHYPQLPAQGRVLGLPPRANSPEDFLEQPPRDIPTAFRDAVQEVTNWRTAMMGAGPASQGPGQDMERVLTAWVPPLFAPLLSFAILAPQPPQRPTYPTVPDILRARLAALKNPAAT
ncbi:MAG: hypothetical protein IPI58_06125 [Alphaproteobacteria bacterium]|nr:MAG: hypothetical protein IPI58_06125 [Alphaproteobacteria bacterium]